MFLRFTFLAIALLAIGSVGCNTGEYGFDRPIYAAMPGLLKADPEISAKIAYNKDGSPAVTFKKGEMFLTFADGTDEGTRKSLSGKAFKIFYDQYMNSPSVKTKGGSYRRDTLGFHGFVGSTELYVYTWKLGDKGFVTVSDRYGNYH